MWEKIWAIDESECSTSRRLWVRLQKRIYITVDHFLKNNISSYASALTNNTVLAAVPVLAIMFAIGRGFGFDNMLEVQIRQKLDFSPETADMVFNFVNSYLQHSRGGVFLGVGILVLIYTLVNLTINIETAFNKIWQVQNSRSIYRSAVNYLSVFFIFPLLLVVWHGLNIFLMTSALMFDAVFSSTVEWLLTFISYATVPIAFILIYKLMPNIRVHWTACIVPGIVMGFVYQGLEYFYIHYQIKLSSYNAIYGSFAALPLFLIFIQLSWYVCLIGAQMCYANQCVISYSFERISKDMSRRFRDSLSLYVMWQIANRFVEGKPALSVHRLAMKTHLPDAMVQMLVDEMVAVNLLAITYNEKGNVRYLPALDVHQLTIKKIMGALESGGSERLAEEWKQANPEWARLRNLRYHVEDALLLDIKDEELSLSESDN